ncbi:MAG: ATPase, T2SS/T4P/T4SS family [Oscillospiraceae bacterium]|nr:ATPase, T2SS/T4P/T4SS family [Oscillospiraceae bacterium]
MLVSDNKIVGLIGFARQNDCTDIHFSMDRPVVLRRMGSLIKTNFDADNEEIEKMILSMLDETQKAKLNENKDIITTFEIPNGFRQRLCVYKQTGKLAAAIHIIPREAMQIESLNVPETIITEVTNLAGMVFITGPVGCGITTTAVSIIEHICNNNRLHVITAEKPVEYVFKKTKSTIHQRELGVDIDSVVDACKCADKADADIIYVSDVSDFETLNAVVTAAENGHAVIACCNANSVIQALDRFNEMCPPERQQQFRVRMANMLRAMINQKLVPVTDGNSQILVNEILMGTDSVASTIKGGKNSQLNNTMQTGSSIGMHTLNSILVKLCSNGTITRETALKYSADRQDLQQYLK